MLLLLERLSRLELAITPRKSYAFTGTPTSD